MLRLLADLVLGARFTLPDALRTAYPDLERATWRRGGLAVRIGGWCLGRATVSGITLWDTISLAEGVALDPELLLHELRHVDQFASDRAFPVRYLWRSLRHGYQDNPYEADARQFAARRVGGAPFTA